MSPNSKKTKFLNVLENMGTSLRTSHKEIASRLLEQRCPAPESPKADLWRGTSYLPYGMQTVSEADEAGLRDGVLQTVKHKKDEEHSVFQNGELSDGTSKAAA
ncbi:hypothetical protein FOPE_03811 [Fonsecaea pedrosoi]|nr:hypothetical protein FOPE_03811 [Fonsecaea pedrosoi]